MYGDILDAASGAPTLPIGGLSLEPFASEQCGARLMAVNHDVYVRDGAGESMLNRIQALLNVLARDSPER
jgi:hypothetical protein